MVPSEVLMSKIGSSARESGANAKVVFIMTIVSFVSVLLCFLSEDEGLLPQEETIRSETMSKEKIFDFIG